MFVFESGAEKMELIPIKKDTHELEFVIKDNRYTFPALLRDRLLRDSSVTFAAYKLEHPLNPDCRFIVKTKGKTAEKALLDACKEIESDLDRFEKSVQKALK